MKKIVCTFLILFSIISCDKNDDSDNNIDQIVGVWNLIGETPSEFNPTGEKSECVSKTNIEFKIDGSYTNNTYNPDSNQICQLTVIEGEWQNIGDSTYKFTFNSESNDAELIFDGDTFNLEGEIFQKQN